MIILKPKVALIGSELNCVRDIYIGVEHKKIVFIGHKKPANYDELIDLPHHILIPSFINSHTHVAMTLLRGLKDDVDLQTWLMEYILPTEKTLKPHEIYYGALYGIAEMIRSGTTLFLDMYYHEIEIAKATIDSGIRAMLSYGSADLFFDHDAKMEFKVAKQFINELESLRSSTNTNERIFYALGPHSIYGCSKDLLELIRDYANEHNVRIHIHLAETKWEVNYSKECYNMTPIEFLDSIKLLAPNVMAAHVVWVSNSDISILSRRGVHVLHNPTSNLKLASGIAPIPNMLQKNINVSLATDGPASNNRLDLWKEMHLAALIHKGYNLDPTVVPAKEVIKMATINGAKALGLHNQLGSIDIGKFADFIIIDLKSMLESTPLHDVYSMIVYALDSRSIESVWLEGKMIYSKSRGFLTLDIEKLREKVEDIRHRLVNEAR